MNYKILSKQSRSATKKAERVIRDRFWTFHSKLVEENPQYTPFFDYIVGNAQDSGLLWEVLEFAQKYLDERTKKVSTKGVQDYVLALEHGYYEWVK